MSLVAAVELAYDTLTEHTTRQLWLDVSHTSHLVFEVQACYSADLFLSAIPHSHDTEYSYRVSIQTPPSQNTIIR